MHAGAVTVARDEARAFYDSHVDQRLRDFVDGNERVDRACATLRAWGGESPARILEVGCGIGYVCARMGRWWPAAAVVGHDISSRSIEAAHRLFASDTIRFVSGGLDALAGPFDLVVLMDVYEHVATEERPLFHASLKARLQAASRLFLSFPTPRHQAFLRREHPEEIQPIDQDVTMGTITRLAADLGTRVLLYQEVSVWHRGDYAHAVLGEWPEWTAAPGGPKPTTGARLWSRLTAAGQPPGELSRAARAALVRQRLGPGACRTRGR